MIDGKGELYLSKSPYNYANNTPVNAIDPDGGLVIFINGQHGGSGGSPEYWKGSFRGYMSIGGSQPFPMYNRFDVAVSSKLNDYNRKYVDGAMGGWSNTAKITYDARDYGGNNLFSKDRINAGFEQGKQDAAGIIANLERDATTGEIVETIKIITHSMGGAYGKGYVKALKEYISTLPKEQPKQVKISLVADFDPFQAGSFSADSDIFTQQFTHIGSIANEKQKDVDEYYEDKTEKAHSITSFFNDISKLQEGTYQWNGSEWKCTTCK